MAARTPWWHAKDSTRDPADRCEGTHQRGMTWGSARWTELRIHDSPVELGHLRLRAQATEQPARMREAQDACTPRHAGAQASKRLGGGRTERKRVGCAAHIRGAIWWRNKSHVDRICDRLLRDQGTQVSGEGATARTGEAAPSYAATRGRQGLGTRRTRDATRWARARGPWGS